MDNVLMLTLAAALAEAAAPPSAPDAHDLRRERGDVVMVDGRPPEGRQCPKHDSASPQPIADPGAHALPPAGPDRRWERRGDDAVLVVLSTGRVARVLAGRFR